VVPPSSKHNKILKMIKEVKNMNKVLVAAKSALDNFECDNSRFVKADYDFDIYSDGYQVDVKMDAKLFQVLGDLVQEFGVGVETHMLHEGVIRVFVSND